MKGGEVVMSGTAGSFRVLARHQLASAAATAVDFAAMTALVELLAVAPEAATLGGALLGACLNYTLNRRYTFRTTGQGDARAEAVRYGLVSGASALLNAVGEYAGTRWLGAPYLLVRVIVSLVVSLGWNYPLHRWFVFHPSAPRAEERLAT